MKHMSMIILLSCIDGGYCHFMHISKSKTKKRTYLPDNLIYTSQQNYHMSESEARWIGMVNLTFTDSKLKKIKGYAVSWLF